MSRAKALRELHWTYRSIGRELNCSDHKAWDLVHRAEPPRKKRRSFNPVRVTVDLTAKKLLATIPPDDRDTTGRLCGDPVKGRSALDRRTAK